MWYYLITSVDEVLLQCYILTIIDVRKLAINWKTLSIIASVSIIRCSVMF